MLQITPISGWETSDGKLFKIAAEAEKHEASLRFARWYDDDRDDHEMCMWGDIIAGECIFEWLCKHKNFIIDLLRNI